MEDEVKQKPKKKQSKLTVPWSDKARKNVNLQRGKYMAKTGKSLNAKVMAGKLLETATFI